MPESSQHFDILIAGAGFAGSLTALTLNSCGFRVCLIEKGAHPRFTIGESSTPIADMILRDLSVKYKLPWLYDFSRYGSWQKAHPEIICGLKRGFSYFKHQPGSSFFTDTCHTRELLVAASVTDELSDTHWLRADFDAFLVDKVKETEINYHDHTEIKAARRHNNEWSIDVQGPDRFFNISAGFMIDASGGGFLLDKLMNVKSSSADFLTNSFAVFSHFEHLPGWTKMMNERGVNTSDYPYNPDDSALHHVLDEGWVWSLRFNNNRTSWGFALNGEDVLLSEMNTEEIWKGMLARYPDLNYIIENGEMSAQPGNILRSGRLQRKAERCFGDGWVALPHSAGFVDPLFSTGIAFSLSGIERLVKALSENPDFGKNLYSMLQDYETAVFAELRLIDLIVAGCYKTMKHFELFSVWSMLYFTFTILYEQRRLRKEKMTCFLEADRPEVKRISETTYKDLLKIIRQETISKSDIDRFTDMVREKIKPFNSAGLLDPSAKNMYHHTVALL